MIYRYIDLSLSPSPSQRVQQKLKASRLPSSAAGLPSNTKAGAMDSPLAKGLPVSPTSTS